MLEILFSSRVRAKILSAIFLSPGERWNANELSHSIGEHYSAVWKELVKLEKIGILSSQKSGKSKDINQLLQLARRDYKTALRNLEDSPDWAYSIAYNSILQARRVLMFNDGYRPRGSDQHATVVEFMEVR
ncbi:MAG: hypothetical protein RBT01_14885 [Anaerolineaceae bacterium]|jgi:hypothetical protein|nr:hypothetical protein [Anaerolineaceae bacterium]